MGKVTAYYRVRGADFEGGGEFCFIEYGLKISVRPGDLLLGATMREWHCNLTPVQGTKYSITCYYRRGLGSLKRRKGWAKRLAKNPPKDRLKAHFGKRAPIYDSRPPPGGSPPRERTSSIDG